MALIEFNVKADVENARRFFNQLHDVEINRAAANALNVLVREVADRSVQEIQQVRRVKGGKGVARSVTIRRAAYYELRATVQVDGRTISLKDYSAKQGPLGVTVNVEGHPKVLQDAFGPGLSRKKQWPYRGKVLGGHVYARETPARLPIKKLFGPGFPSGFLKAVVQRNLAELYTTRWPVIFAQKCHDQLDKLRATVAR